jgi:GYF domain 2
MARTWYCTILGQDLGPLSFAELRELVRAGTLSRGDRVRAEGAHAWERAESIVGLFHEERVATPAPEEDPAPVAAAVVEPTSEPAGAADTDDRVRGARRTFLFIATVALGLAVVVAWNGLAARAERNRFPTPGHMRAANQPVGHWFFGFGPMSLFEYGLLWFDAVAVCAGVAYCGYRWRKAERE